MPRLFVLSGDDLGRVVDFDRAVVLGRGEDADVRLAATSVSRAHARIEPDPDGGWRLVDLGSRNGVTLDFRRVTSVSLTDGAVFKLGDLELRFRAEVARDVGSAPPIAPAPVRAPAPARLPEPSAPRRDDGGLELEGDWEDVVPPPSTRVAPPLAPPLASAPAAPRSSAGPPAQGAGGSRDARRAEHLRAAGVAARLPAATIGGPAVGKPVLQYHRVGEHGGGDLAQRPAWVRLVAVVFAVACCAGAAYGALQLTRKVRASQATMQGEDPADDAESAGG